MHVKKIIACIGIAAAVSAQKVQAKELVPCHECHMKRLPKASELPLYDKVGDQNIECVQVAEMSLVTEISVIRKQMADYIAYLDGFRKRAVNVYETGLAHSQSTFDYLKSEENKISRVMLIASGGLLGFIAARRGGILRKMFYSSAGSGLIFSAFYPSLTKEYLLVSIDYTKNQTSSLLEKYGGNVCYHQKSLAMAFLMALDMSERILWVIERFRSCVQSIDKELAITEVEQTIIEITIVIFDVLLPFAGVIAISPGDMIQAFACYDTKKMAEEANAKVDYLKSVIMYESLMAKLNELFYRNKNILTSSSQKSGNHSEKTPDEDMYTTR